MLKYLLPLLLIPGLAFAQSIDPEMQRANLEVNAGQALFDLGQKRVEVVQLKKEIAELRTKCGKVCEDAPGTK